MKNKSCPACGNENLIRTNENKIISEAFAGNKSIDVVNYSCNECGMEGDFFNENETALKETLSEIKSDAVISILNDFIENNISLSSLERALEIPQRTLTKYKNNKSKPSSIGVALFKLLRLFPWLINVAENKYDYELSQQIFMMKAFENEFWNKLL